jgi:hypothetical protein
MEQITPKARNDRLLVEDLHDETLVYDLDSNEASCLNQAAAIVWKHSDGRTTVAQLAKVLSDKLGTPLDEKVVWLALDQLREHHLLLEPAARPDGLSSLSRREFLKLGLAGAVLPLVTSVVAPSADQFGSRGQTGPDGQTGADGQDGTTGDTGALGVTG